MEYIFFDIECANCFNGDGKICSFGYVITDRFFNILEKEDIVLPVAELNIQYKNSAKLEDNVTIKTKVSDYGKFYITFHQEIIDEKTEK